MLTRLQTSNESGLSRQSQVILYAINLVLLLMLGWLDYLTGDYSLIIFYLFPVGLATWFITRTSGLFFCVLSFLTHFIADEAFASFTFQFSALHFWNLCVEFIFLVIMSLLCSALKQSLTKTQARAERDSL